MLSIILFHQHLHQQRLTCALLQRILHVKSKKQHLSRRETVHCATLSTLRLMTMRRRLETRLTTVLLRWLVMTKHALACSMRSRQHMRSASLIPRCMSLRGEVRVGTLRKVNLFQQQYQKWSLQSHKIATPLTNKVTVLQTVRPQLGRLKPWKRKKQAGRSVCRRSSKLSVRKLRELRSV